MESNITRKLVGVRKEELLHHLLAAVCIVSLDRKFCSLYDVVAVAAAVVVVVVDSVVTTFSIARRNFKS